MKARFNRAVGCGVLTLMGLAWVPLFAQVVHFDVPSEDAGKSIPELGRQARVQIIAPGEMLHGLVTPAIKGSYDLRLALEMMLKGTDLVVDHEEDGIITISVREPGRGEEDAVNNSKREAMRSVSLFALLFGALTAQASQAQSTTTVTSDDQTIETVVVTAQRAAIQTAIQTKLKSEEIIDSVAAQDIGKLPDNSITEVLQRVAGVNMTRIATGTNSEDYVGEGTQITIRGLSNVVSQLNGRDAFSAANGRSLSWEDIPPELAQGVDVYKSLSARLPEGGFGGIINLRTRQPFDFDGLTVDATLNGNFADYSRKGNFGGSALVSDRWHTKLGEMGLLLNVAYSDLQTRADGVQVSPYEPTVWSPNYPSSSALPWVSTYNLGSDSLSPTACSGNAAFTCQEVYVPSAISYTQQNDERIRTGLYAAFQWNVNDRLQLFATAFRSRYTDNTLSHTISNTVSGYVALDPSSTNTFDKNGNLLSSNGLSSFAYEDPNAATYFGVNSGWDYQAIPYQFDSNLNHVVNQTVDISTGGEWDPSDRLSVNFALQHVESMGQNNGHWADLYAFVPGYGVTLSPYGSATLPVLSFPSTDLANQNRYGWNDTMDHLTDDTGQENAIYLDGSLVLSDSAFLRAVKFGVKITDRTENDWETPYNWQALTPPYQDAWVVVNGSGQPVYNTSGNVEQCFAASTTCQSVSAASVNAIKTAGNTASGFTTLVNTGSWFNGQVGLPAQAWFPSAALLNSNYTTLHSYTQGLGAPGDQQTAVAYTADDQSRLKETVEAFYGQLEFSGDRWGANFSGNVGVRVLAYKDSASGYFDNAYFNTPIYLTSPSSYLDCQTTPYNQYCLSTGSYQPNAISFTVPKTYVAKSGSHSEVDALPSINLMIVPFPDRAPGFKIRLAASQGVSRPDFGQLSPKGSGSGSYVGTYQSYFNGNMGNPGLEPEKADQFDASFEYYFESGGLVHISPFYKRIHNYIANAETVVSTTLPAVVAGGTDFPPPQGAGTMGCAMPVTIGETCPQTVSMSVVMPINEKKTAIVDGYEVGLTKYADFLPDPFNSFGIDLNYTYVDSQQPGALAYDMKGNLIPNLPALGLSKNTVNAALMFDRQPFSFRLAYNWRDDFLITTAAYQTTNTYNYALYEPSTVSGGVLQGDTVHYSLPVFQYPSGQLDASMTYTLTDNVTWSLEASNLTKEVARLYMGVGDHRVNRSWYTADTRYTTQLRLKF